MNKTDFSFYRKLLGKTQREMAQLLGTSIKAIHSYEQGWRNVPVHAERQLLFLASRKNHKKHNRTHCWDLRECPVDKREQCPAWEFGSGELCWFINGTICEGYVHSSWKEKMESCRTCNVFKKKFS